MTSLTDLVTPLGLGSAVDASGPRVGARLEVVPHAGARPVRMSSRAPWAVVAADALAAIGCLAVAGGLGARAGSSLVLLLPPLWLLALALAGAYETGAVGMGTADWTSRVGRAGAGLALTATAGIELLRLPTDPGLALLASAALAATSLGIRVGNGLAADGSGAAVTRVLVAGSHPGDVRRVLSELDRARRPGVEVAAVCVDPHADDVAFDVPVNFGLHHLADAAVAHRATAVIVLPCDHLGQVELRRIGWQLERVGVRLLVDVPLLDVSASRTSLRQVAGLRMVGVRPCGRRGLRQLAKSLVERVAAAAALVLLAPALLALCACIRLDSPGPAIFRQTRVGRNGRQFTMYKLRTMSVDAERVLGDLGADNESDGVLFKMRRDPRITRIGAVLRRYSLDEVPQLFNVVLGHMSLVGPRPALRSEVMQYDQDARHRLVVKPGLTGLWQVSGRSDLSWEDTVRLDLRYVDNWSLTLDAAILARTVRAVLSQRGAY